MKVTLEPTGFLARISTEEAAREPMPWDYVGSAHITLDEYHIATIKGMVAPKGRGLSASMAIIDKLTQIGVLGAVWSHKINGVFVPKTIKIHGDGRTIYL